MVMCVRKPDNEILTNVEEINSITERHKPLGVPFLRGIVLMFENLYLGLKGIVFSANIFAEDEEGEEFGYKEFAVVAAGVIGLLAFFFVAPFLLTEWLNLNGVAFNVVEALIRLSFFIAYLAIISSWGEVRRVFQYHGAEHKAINAHEAGSSLEVEDVKNYSRLHPRCGTSFLVIVLIVSIVLFSVMPDLSFAVRLSYRILLIPVIAGISYELLRLSGRYRDSVVMKIITLPGLGFQLLTTKEPTEDMIEVAVKAVQEVNKLSH